VHVLKDVHLSVARGESIGLVGPSGSGKSTLLMVIAGLERTDSGEVRIGGRDYAGMSEDALAEFRGATIGFVFQAFHLMQTMTALENVAVPLELAGRADALPRACAMLTRVGLGDRL
jgi:putative ABC transport system ATP-binding protein